MVVVGGLGENLKLNSYGATINRGVVKCPRNTASYILSTVLKLFPSSSLNTTITGMIVKYVFSAFDCNFFLCVLI